MQPAEASQPTHRRVGRAPLRGLHAPHPFTDHIHRLLAIGFPNTVKSSQSPIAVVGRVPPRGADAPRPLNNPESAPIGVGIGIGIGIETNIHQ